MDRSVLDEVIAAVETVDRERGRAARARLEERGGALGLLLDVAERVAAIKRTPAPPLERKVIVLVGADHGDAPSGGRVATDGDAPSGGRVATDGDAPSGGRMATDRSAAAERASAAESDAVDDDVVAAGATGSDAAERVRRAAAGTLPVNVLARAAGAQIVVIDGGLASDVSDAPGVLSLRVGRGTADATRGPAMTGDQALVAVQTGIALALSLASEGLDAVAAATLGAGAERAAVRVAAALAPFADAPGADGVEGALSILGHVGGFDLGIVAGLVLGCAAIRVPAVLDGAGAVAAAGLAVRMAPPVAGALFLAETPAAPEAAALAQALGLRPLGATGIATGDGAAAALALPLLWAAVRLQRELR